LYVDDQVGRLILEVQGLIAVLETGVEKCWERVVNASSDECKPHVEEMLVAEALDSGSSLECIGRYL
jgi:hypothetical protein